MLFNDLLVFASKGDSKQSEVELVLDLSVVWLQDLEDLDPQSSKYDLKCSTLDPDFFPLFHFILHAMEDLLFSVFHVRQRCRKATRIEFVDKILIILVGFH